MKEYNDDEGGDDDKTENRKSTKTFEGAEKKGARNKPVEFEKQVSYY